MKHFLLIILLASISAKSHAQTVEFGFTSLDPKLTTVDGSKSPIAMLPQVKNQLYWGLCATFAIQALYAGHLCKMAKKADCDHSPEFMLSVIDIARYGTIVKGSPENESRDFYSGFPMTHASPLEAKKAQAESFKKIQTSGLTFIEDDTIEFGIGAQVILFNLTTRIGYALKEDAVPFDKIFAKPGDETEMLKAGILAKQELQRLYFSLKEKNKPCDQSCLIKAKALFNFITPDEEIIAAFNEPDYGNFLNKILIPRKIEDDMSDEVSMVMPDDEFVTKDGKRGTYQEISYANEPRANRYKFAIETIKTNLKNKNAMMVAGYCTMPKIPKSIDECKGLLHIFVINGYKKVCDQDNKNCVDAIKVHNSWGQKWQDKFMHEGSDGWVNAKELLDRTFYRDESISWFDETAKGTPFPPGHFLH